MTRVSDIQNNFLQTLSDCRSLFTHCLNPIGPHTNAGVESAFLEAFKAWEVFLEDLTIAYLTGQPDIAGNLAPAVVSFSGNNPETCRKIISGGRAFVSWANLDEIRNRFDLYFTPGLLYGKLNSGVAEIKEMVKCRNAIAHSSGSAYNNLNDLWREKSGTSRSPLRSADVLLLSYLPNAPSTWFERYLQVLEVMSQNLVQI